MSLSARDRQSLKSIEEGLAGCDPKLASILGAFTRLTAGEAMPGPETIRGRPGHAVRSGRTRRRSRRGNGGRARWQWAWLLLWLSVSLALITTAVLLSRASPGRCPAPRAPACASHAAQPAAGQAAAGRALAPPAR